MPVMPLRGEKKKPQKLFQSIESLQIKSLKQTMLDQHHFIFDGEVEVLVDKTMHIWADRVEIDKQLNTLHATSVYGSPIKIEMNDFLILAETFTLNMTEKTGSADKIKIHIQEGYLAAAKAEKLSENHWSMKDIMYTSCDAHGAHWSLRACSAVVHGGIFVRLTGVLFRILKIPVFGLPYLIIPLQDGSRSGFLIPKFYFDYELGFGVKAEYYHYFGSRCDTTIGFDWQDRKGFVISDEFRWARNAESYSLANAYFAVVKNSFSRKIDKIVRTTKNRYWMSGFDFCNFSLFDAHVASLSRIDFGTDKKIGYQFFNTIKDVDDEFLNTLMLRCAWPQGQAEIRLDGIKIKRKGFSELSNEEHELFSLFSHDLIVKKKIPLKKFSIEKRECQNQVTLNYLPHIEWNFLDRIFGKYFYYSHDLMADYVDYHESEVDRLYFNGMIEREERFRPTHHTQLLRINYSAYCGMFLNWYAHAFSFTCKPVAQVRTKVRSDEILRKRVLEHRVRSYGAARYFFNYAAEWALPTISMSNQNGSCTQFFQALWSWDYVPTFDQHHWFELDVWDTWYARNELALQFFYNLTASDKVIFDLDVRQGVDFNRNKDFFPLRRPLNDHHLLPFELHASLHFPGGNLSLNQEYDFMRGRILSSLFFTRLRIENFSFGIGYLYYDREIQKKRELLSRVPHFFVGELIIPFSKRFSLYYDGHFYAEIGGHDSIKPLLHRVRLEYNGHCWGFYIGYEEKRYREHGIGKGERAFVFSLRLDSLGSFAKKFRNPEVVYD